MILSSLLPAWLRQTVHAILASVSSCALATSSVRKLDWDWNLANTRVFKRAEWLTHMFKLHVLDHPERGDLSRPEQIASFENPYLDG